MEDKKRSDQLKPIKSIDPTLKTRQSHTTNTGSARLFHMQRYKERNKSSAILRGSAAMRRITIYRFANKHRAYLALAHYGAGRAP